MQRMAVVENTAILYSVQYTVASVANETPIVTGLGFYAEVHLIFGTVSIIVH